MSEHLSGLTAWLVQRLSAVYLLVYMLVAPWVILSMPAFDYAHWHELMANPWVAISTAMCFLSLFLHLWVGIRDVILDYAGRWPNIRLLLLSLCGAWLIALGIWTLKIVIVVMV